MSRVLIASITSLIRRLQLVGCIFEVGDEGFFHGGIVHALRTDTGQAVDLGVAQHLRVGNRQIDPGAELFNAIRQTRDTALALGPVTGRQVEQHLGQTVGIEPGLDFRRAEVVREQVFHTTETGLGGGVETGKEILFGEQHGQVGSETRHGGLLKRF
jgi:hypothetical protein